MRPNLLTNVPVLSSAPLSNHVSANVALGKACMRISPREHDGSGTYPREPDAAPFYGYLSVLT
jgi:hypothetical protein